MIYVMDSIFAQKKLKVIKKIREKLIADWKSL